MDIVLSTFTNNIYNEISNYFFAEKVEDRERLSKEWKIMKIELLHLKKSWLQFKKSIEDNNMKMKGTATEWTLRRILKNFDNIDELTKLYEIAKIALITPVTNAWPERGASAVKRIKTRSRSQMKDDLINALLMISVNGPDFKTPEYENLMEEVTTAYQKKNHKKNPGNFNATISLKQTSSTSTQTIDLEHDDIENQIENIDKQLEQTIKNTEPWIINEIENATDDDTDDSDNDSAESESK